MRNHIAVVAAAALVTTIAVQARSLDVGTTTPPSMASASARHGCRLPGPYGYPHGSKPVHLRPRDFTTRIDNPYWPMRPGTIWRYVERNAHETQHITVRVTHRTRVLGGVRARVVHDVVRSGGEVVEDTHDWYAQDSGGSIWYLGEATKEYENGKVVRTEGSWRYGRRGAQAGIVVPARTHAGCSYREEYLKGEAQDRGLVLSRREAMKTPTGFHRHVLHTANSTPLEPAVLENKFYARGIGPVLEIDVSPTWSRAELVKVARR
ncbi:MAG: hypothetical protein ABIR34_07620 [Marmoricola sp.]